MGNPRQIGVGLSGLSVIGTSVAKILTERTRSIRQEINGTLHLENVLVKDALKHRKITLPQKVLTTDPELLISNRGISVIIKAIGGTSVTLRLIQAALSRGKHVVPGNKKVLAKQ